MNVIPMAGAMTVPAATILIVDDERPNRELLKVLLQHEGYLTLEAAGGEEALASVAQGTPDLILLDIMMPGMDGYQVVAALKANPATSQIPIILVSALTDRGARLAGLTAGAEELLTKPVDRTELGLRVRNLLRLKAYADLLRDQNSMLDQQVSARTESLHTSELRFRQLAENIDDVFFLRSVDADSMLYVSPAYESVWGRSCESLYADAGSWRDAVHPDDRESVGAELVRWGRSSGESQMEYRIVRPDGSTRWIESRGFPVRDENDKLVRIAGVAKDITKRKAAADRIAYLNRVYAVLSGINNLIVHVRDHDTLFQKACQIVVNTGAFRMAWIGMVEDAAMKINVVASNGVGTAHLAEIQDCLNPGDATQPEPVPALRAVREKKAIVVNDLKANPAVKHHASYVESDISSMIVLPLVDSGAALGVLVLYARDDEFFHEEEQKLLSELASDIAFAVNQIKQRERIEYLGFYDDLTGLANFLLLNERLNLHIRNASVGQHKLALFLIDIERFKNINDSMGQSAGDTLLKLVANWLAGHSGDVGLVARVGADQFALIMPQVYSSGSVARHVESTLRSFTSHAFRIQDTELKIAVKIGVAIFPNDGDSAEVLFRNAEAALKKAKSGGDRYLFYTQKMTARVAARLTLENQLREAFENEEFVLHYQPKANLTSGKLTSAEALIRWNNPRLGLVPPAQFIPILEETGLIFEVGRWALHKAIEDYLRWRAAGLTAVRVAVNVSPLQLRNAGFTAEIAKLTATNAHAAEALEIEITEGVVMEDVNRSIADLTAIHATGVKIAIDDFGTGFSSLSYLSRLPVDSLKIDRSFVTDMSAGPEGLAMVSTIINLAHALKLKVVAEGVETAEQSHLLRLLSCDEMQGYLLSKALPSEAFEAAFLTPAAMAAN